MQNNLNDKAEILMETLPFMRRYSNKVIVIKFGGHAMGKKEYVKTFAQDVSLLQQVGILPIVVHGGGPQIGEMLKKLKIESNFIDGLRVTDVASLIKVLSQQYQMRVLMQLGYLVKMGI